MKLTSEQILTLHITGTALLGGVMILLGGSASIWIIAGIVCLITAVGLWQRWKWARFMAIIIDIGLLLLLVATLIIDAEPGQIDAESIIIALCVMFPVLGVLGGGALWLFKHDLPDKVTANTKVSASHDVAPPVVPSPAVVSSILSGGGGHLASPRLLILLVNRMPSGGPEAHIKRLLVSLPPQERPDDVILRVSESYADQGTIAVDSMFTPLMQGISANQDRTWYRSYSTADGVTGTQIFIYE